MHKIGYPPEPIATRWGTWLEASNYYCRNLNEVKNIVEQLPCEGKRLDKARNAVKAAGLIEELVLIENNYYKFVKIINDLEARSMTIARGYTLLNLLEFDSDPVSIKKYIQDRLQRNGITEIIEFKSKDVSLGV